MTLQATHERRGTPTSRGRQMPHAEPAVLPQLLTVEQVAAVIQVHPESVRRWIRAGRLPAAQLGGRRLGYRVDSNDLRRFFDGNRADVDSFLSPNV